MKEFLLMTKIIEWFKNKFKSDRRKCIKIRPERTWPRESHE